MKNLSWKEMIHNVVAKNYYQSKKFIEVMFLFSIYCAHITYFAGRIHHQSRA